jgi:hypothetical protein
MTFDKIIQFVYFLISCTIFNNFDLSLLEISYIPVVFIWWRRAGVDTRLGASVTRQMRLHQKKRLFLRSYPLNNYKDCL